MIVDIGFKNRKNTEDKLELIEENNIIKIKINEYMTIIDYISQINSINYDGISELINNSVLWNNRKQQINKGTLYIMTNYDTVYNIFLHDQKVKVSEKITKPSIIEEKIISLDIDNDTYNYVTLKHDRTGNTFYTEHYDKNNHNKREEYGMLSAKQTQEEIGNIINNLEKIELPKEILDLNILKEKIINNLELSSQSKNKKLKKIIG